MTWAIRASSPARSDADALPARGALGSRLREHVQAGTITLLTGFGVQSVTPGPDGVEVCDGTRIVSATGFRPDHGIDPIMGSTRASPR